MGFGKCLIVCLGLFMTYELVLALILTFSPWYEDINEKDREGRMATIAFTQVEVGAQLAGEEFPGTQEELVALLMTAGWWETRYNKRIHAGNCHADECDGGKARSVYQIQMNGTYPDEIWEDSVGLGMVPTFFATMGAGLSFSAAWRACHEAYGIRGVWAAYGIGRCDGSFPHLISRVRWYEKVLARL